jgi:hypothetical protein
MYRALGLVGLAVIAVTSCSSSHSTHPVAAPRPHVTSTPVSAQLEPLAVLHSKARRGITRRLRREAIVLSPSRVELEVGGSGTCPPSARSATIDGRSLLLRFRRFRGCTEDLVLYTVVVTLNQPVFNNPEIVSLGAGIGKPKGRLPLVLA